MLYVGWLRNIIASFWNANQSSQEPSDNALRCWQTVVPFECLFPSPPILFMKDTLIYCNQHLFSLPRFTLSPLSNVVVHSSLCEEIIPQVTIHTQPAGNSVCIVQITILWSLTDWKLYLLTVVSPHILLRLEREGLLNITCRICVAYMLGLYICPTDIKERFTNYVLLLIVCLRNMEQFSWKSGLDCSISI